MTTNQPKPATTKDLKVMESRLDKKIDSVEFNVQQDIKNLGEILPTRNEIKDWKDEILHSNDILAKKMDVIISEFPAQKSRTDRIDETVENIKIRLDRVEKQIGLTA